MSTCPICGNEHSPNTACKFCGYDFTLEYESQPTFFLVSDQKSIETRRRLWEQSRRRPDGLYHCPICSNAGFFVIPEREIFLCQQCRSAIPVNRVLSCLTTARENSSPEEAKLQAPVVEIDADEKSTLYATNTGQFEKTVTPLPGLKAEILWFDQIGTSKVMQLLTARDQVAFASEQVVLQIICNQKNPGKLASIQRGQTGEKSEIYLSGAFILTFTNAGIYLISDFGSFFGSQSISKFSLKSVEVIPYVNEKTNSSSCRIELERNGGANYACIINVDTDGNVEDLSSKLNSVINMIKDNDLKII